MTTLVITPEVERDVERLAARTGVSAEQAVADAVRNQLRLLHPQVNPRGIDWAAVDALVEKIKASGPIDYSLTDDEILGYDESGAPEQPWLHGR